MAKFDGFLFSKLDLIGSRSEGPQYFLQQFDYSELYVVKQVHLWEEDPALQPFVGQKVTVEGRLNAGRLSYEQVKAYNPPPVRQTNPA